MSDICPHTKKEYNCSNCKGAEMGKFGGNTGMHMCHSVSGPLRTWGKREWNKATKYITKTDGSKMTPEEVKEEFWAMHAKGRDAFPTGTCDNFCYKTGCRGHAVANEKSAESAS